MEKFKLRNINRAKKQVSNMEHESRAKINNLNKRIQLEIDNNIEILKNLD